MKHLCGDQALHFYDRLERSAADKRCPVDVTFELTYACNFRCPHCYNPVHQALPGELSTAEVCGILKQCAEAGVLTVTFSGGEPLARGDLLEIIGYARNLGLLVRLFSNAALLTPELAEQFQNWGVSEFSTSLYGATPAVYEKVTGVPGSFERFLRGMCVLSSSSLYSELRVVITRDNFKQFREIVELARSFKMHFRYSLEIQPKSNGDPSPLGLRLSPEETARVFQEAEDLGISGWREPSAEDEAEEKSFLNCSCGKTQFAVTPYGEMNLCVMFPLPRFDLRKATVAQGWEVLKKTADAMRPGAHYDCPDCDLRGYCRQGRNDAFLETGDLNVCLPHFKTLAEFEKSFVRTLRTTV